MAQYRAFIVAAGVFLLAFWGVELASASLAPALLIALAFAGGAGLLTHTLLPPDPELEHYRLDVRRRVRTVFATTEAIDHLSERVKDPDSKRALQEGCRVIHDLMKYAQEKDPSNMAATAAKIGVYLTSVKSALEVHLQIEANPEYFTDAQQLLSGGRDGFVAFREFALGSVRQLNQGEVMSLRANLGTLKPMTIPELGAPR